MEPLAGLWDAAPGAPLQISYPNASRKWISPSPACQNNTEDMALRPKPEHGKNRFRQLANTRNTFHGCRTPSLRPNQLRLQSVRHSYINQSAPCCLLLFGAGGGGGGAGGGRRRPGGGGAGGS